MYLHTINPSLTPTLSPIPLQKGGFQLISDGWKSRAAGQGAPLVNFIILKPAGGRLFLKVVDTSGQPKTTGKPRQVVKGAHVQDQEEASLS